MLELILPSNPKKATYKKISNPFRKILYLFALHSDHPLYLKHKDNLIGVSNSLTKSIHTLYYPYI